MINDHFMPPIRKLLIDFRGPRLAIGVGVSYPDTAPYLKCFDYVIVRSQADFAMATPFVSEGYLELYPDLTYFMDRKNVIKPKQVPVENQSDVIRIGLCVAEPCLATAYAHGTQLVSSIAEMMSNVTLRMRQDSNKSIKWILIPFNTNQEHEYECDWKALERIRSRLVPPTEYEMLDMETAADPTKLLNYFTEHLDLVVGMRYHSIMFSIISGTPFVALYSTPKIGNLLKYISLDGTESDHQMEYANASADIPCNFRVDTLTDKVISKLTTKTVVRKRLLPHNQTAYAAKIRKLIRSDPKFPQIPSSSGYDIKYLDEHHMNRLAFGTVRQFLDGRSKEKDIDGILDGRIALSSVLDAEEENSSREIVAEHICTMLLSRLHQGKYTNVVTMSEDVTQQDQISKQNVAKIYLDGFAGNIYNETIPLREQLSWITNDYYRNLHPVPHSTT